MRFKKSGNNFGFTGAKIVSSKQHENPIDQAAFEHQVTALLKQNILSDKDIIYINIGVNDIWQIIDSYYLTLTFLQDVILDMAIASYQKSVEKLVQNNAKRIILSNMPSLIETPKIIASYAGTNLITYVENLSLKFNERFNKMFCEMQLQYQNVAFELQDFYQGFNEFIVEFRNNPRIFEIKFKIIRLILI